MSQIQTHDLARAVDFARKARGSSPFVGIANGHGTMMFRRDIMRATLKGLEIVDVEVGPYKGSGNAQSSAWECERVLIVHAKSPDGRVRAKRVFIPAKDWKQSPLLESWQRAERRKMGRCDCWEFRRGGTCKHTERRTAPKLNKWQKAIAKLEKEMPKEWRPGNPALPEYREPASDAERRQWHEWRLQKGVRREVMRLARMKGATAQLYAKVGELTASHYAMTNWEAYFNSTAEERPEPVYALVTEPLKCKKWSELGTDAKRRLDNDLFEYLKVLWKFCGLASKPFREAWEEGSGHWGAGHYQQWLKDLWERRRIQAQIDAIRVVEGEMARKRAESALEASEGVAGRPAPSPAEESLLEPLEGQERGF